MVSAETDCSVVMVSYYTGGVLFHAIESVLRQQNLGKLIIVNNGNTPDVVDKLKKTVEQHEHCELITGQGNIGFAAACNLGAKHSNSPYLLLLNPDCILAPDTLSQFAEEFLHSPEITLAGPLLLNADNTEQRGGRRNIITPHSMLGEILPSLLRRKLPRINLNKTPLKLTPMKVPAISGACMYLRTKDYNKLGGMDEGFFLHMEDMDFCKRIHDEGGKTVCIPTIATFHARSTSDVSSSFVEKCKVTSTAYYLEKHYGSSYQPWKIKFLIQLLWMRYILIRSISILKNRKKHPSIQEKKIALLLHLAQELPAEWAASYKNKTVAITGATSAVGIYLTGCMIAAGAKVIALTRMPLPISLPGLSWIKADISQAETLPEVLDARYLLHTAPIWLLPKTVNWWSQHGIERIVCISSTSVVTKSASEYRAEQQLARQLKDAEQHTQIECEKAGIAYTILRPTLIYGAALDYNISKIFYILQKYRILVLPKRIYGNRQPVHISSVAAAAAKAATSTDAKNKTYTITGEETMSYKTMVTRISSVVPSAHYIYYTDLLTSLLSKLAPYSRRAAGLLAVVERMQQDLAFDNTDAIKDFNYIPSPFMLQEKDIKGYTL